MTAWVSSCAAAFLAMAAALVQSSETMTPAPGQPAPKVTERRLARVESLDGKTKCEIALAPNGVLQFTTTCSGWPAVAKSKQWAREGSRIRFLDAQGAATITFYATGSAVFVTGRADPEFLRLTILPPPAQLRLQPSIPLKQ